MSALTNIGRAALAKAVKERSLMLAWGTGQSWWDSTITNNYTFGTSGPNLNKVPLQYKPYPAGPGQNDVVVSTVNYDGLGNGSLYVKNTDYTVDYTTGVITRMTTGGIANGGSVKITYTARRPEADVNRTSLFAEVGRHKLTLAQFVVPDPAGAITVTSGRFNPTANNTPSNYLFIQFGFDYADGQGFTIRELGVCMDTVVDPLLPPGKLYYVPTEIIDPGILFLIENIPPLTRAVATKQTMAVVVEF